MNYKSSPNRASTSKIKSSSSPVGKLKEGSTFGNSSPGERLAIPVRSALPSNVLKHPSIMKVKERLTEALPPAYAPSLVRIETAQSASKGIAPKPTLPVAPSSSGATIAAPAAVSTATNDAGNEASSLFVRPVRKRDNIRKKSPEKFKPDPSSALETEELVFFQDETKAMKTHAPMFEGYEPEKMTLKRNSIVVDDEIDPNNWTWVKDEDTQLYYYVNLRTMKSQWNKPKCLDNIVDVAAGIGMGSPGGPRGTKTTMLRASKIRSPSQQRRSSHSTLLESSALDDDPENWTWQLDKETNLYYYINLTTRVSQWEKPVCLVKVTPQQNRFKKDLITVKGATEFAITLAVIVFFGCFNMGPILIRRFFIHVFALFM